MFDFLGRIFGKDQGSKEAAKERLRLVLVHDRASLSPHLIDNLREEIIGVISKYMEIDEDGLEVAFDREDESMALVANIPIRRVRRGDGVNANP